MPYPLLTAALKKDRAADHIIDFQAQLPEVIKTQPHTIRRDPQGDSGEFFYERAVGNDFLMDLGPIVGDAIHNLRSALDHIAYAVALSDTARLKPKDLFAVDFRICPNRKKFETAVGKGVESRMRPDWVKFLRSVQPYYRRNGDDLLRISALDNADKHRALLELTPFLSVRIQRDGGEWVSETHRLKKGVVRIPFDSKTNVVASRNVAFSDAARRKEPKVAMVDLLGFLGTVTSVYLAAQARFFPMDR